MTAMPPAAGTNTDQPIHIQPGMPPAGVPGAAPVGPGGMPYYGPPPSNGAATAALVLGIIGMVGVVITSPFAIWLGIKGMREAEMLPYRAGHGMALAGMILGIIGTVILALYALFILWIMVLVFSV